MTSWNSTTPMRAYSFVFNDKYEGTFKTLAAALGDLEQQNPNVRCRPFTAAHLEDTFINLPPASINSVLGAILPDPSRIVSVDYGVLREVIAHIMSSPSAQIPTRFGDLPMDGVCPQSGVQLIAGWLAPCNAGCQRRGEVPSRLSGPGFGGVERARGLTYEHLATYPQAPARCGLSL